MIYLTVLHHAIAKNLAGFLEADYKVSCSVPGYHSTASMASTNSSPIKNPLLPPLPLSFTRIPFPQKTKSQQHPRKGPHSTRMSSSQRQRLCVEIYSNQISHGWCSEMWRWPVFNSCDEFTSVSITESFVSFLSLSLCLSHGTRTIHWEFQPSALQESTELLRPWGLLNRVPKKKRGKKRICRVMWLIWNFNCPLCRVRFGIQTFYGIN